MNSDFNYFWSPPDCFFSLDREKANSSVRIAAVVGDRLYHGLRHESELIFLTLANWELVLKYGEIGFILIEYDNLSSSSGRNHLGLFTEQKSSLIHEIVLLGKKLNIPTVLWDTLGRAGRLISDPLVRKFDYLFSVDSAVCQELKKAGMAAEVLLPAVQPSRFNRFMLPGAIAEKDSIELLCNGVYSEKEVATFTHMLTQYGLRSVLSPDGMRHLADTSLKHWGDFFLGAVGALDWLNVLKCSRAFLSDWNHQTAGWQQWQELEAIACGVPVLRWGTPSNYNVLDGFTNQYDKVVDILIMLESFREDDIYRRRVAHLAWREVSQNHTFAHRLCQICKSLGIENDYEQYPGVTVVTSIKDPEEFWRVIEVFEQQDYPQKELRVLSAVKVREGFESRQNVQIIEVDEHVGKGNDIFAGAGDFDGNICFYIDPEYRYGTRYLLDNMLNLQPFGRGVAGKFLSLVASGDDEKAPFKHHFSPATIFIPDRRVMFHKGRGSDSQDDRPMVLVDKNWEKAIDCDDIPASDELSMVIIEEMNMALCPDDMSSFSGVMFP